MTKKVNRQVRNQVKSIAPTPQQLEVMNELGVTRLEDAQEIAGNEFPISSSAYRILCLSTEKKETPNK